MPNGTCCVVSFGIKGGREAATKFMDSLKLAAIVTHVADTRSCCLRPASTTHRQLTDEQLEELCRNCGFFCTRQERYLCIRIWEQGSAMDDAQCDLYLQQYFAEGTEFILSTRLPDAELCVAVFACEEKRQSEILRKLRMFVSKYTEYTVAVG